MTMLPESAAANAIRARSAVDSDGCWLWTACTNAKGYGYIWWNGRGARAHRLSYEAFVGPIPEGFAVHHKCGVRACVNPRHLSVIEHGEHARMHLTGYKQRVITRCKHGHAFDKENTRIRTDGKRSCIACERRHSRERWRLHKEAA